MKFRCFHTNPNILTLKVKNCSNMKVFMLEQLNNLFIYKLISRKAKQFFRHKVSYFSYLIHFS